MAGFACFYGGAAISWQAKSLKLVPLSSAEAEANVLSLGCKDAVYVRRLLTELRPGKIKSCIATFTDNQAAIDIIKAHGLTRNGAHQALRALGGLRPRPVPAAHHRRVLQADDGNAR